MVQFCSVLSSAVSRLFNVLVCCINVECARPVVSVLRPPTCTETEPKTEHGLEGNQHRSGRLMMVESCVCAILITYLYVFQDL